MCVDRVFTHNHYDPVGRPLSYRVGEETQSVEYDEVGRMIAFVDALGQRTLFEYDGLDRVVRELAFDGREKRAAFNLVGELVYSFDNGNITEYQYGRAINAHREQKCCVG